MNPTADPAFEVATVKLSNPASTIRGFRVQSRQFLTFGSLLIELIGFAYDLQFRQIIGIPSWVESERYDLVVRSDGEGQPSEAQWKSIVRKVLAERFQLRVHNDSRELSVYTISVARGGLKLTVSEGDPSDLPSVGFDALGSLSARNAPIVDFAHIMQNVALDRPVIDQTGLTGRYDFMLKWVADEFQFPDFHRPGGPPAPEMRDGVDLFTAMQQQLGLNLTAKKANAPVIVIDHVEKPSEN